MTMTRKYFFFDIDGTLTDRYTGKIVPSAAHAVQKLEEAGHFVAINTGRAHYRRESSSTRTDLTIWCAMAAKQLS